MKKYIVYIFICLTFTLLNREAQAQQKLSNIFGTVVNSAGTPLQGITVINGEQSGLERVTGSGGSFSIQGKIGQHLLIKKSGKLIKKVTINKDTLNITLKKEAFLRIPIGYGRTRSKDGLTAAIGVARAADLAEQSAIMSPENLLYGKIPGLMAFYTGGTNLPGAASFLIRGEKTTRSDGPLILVDGFQQQIIRTLPPMAIKSVSVLKDAAALAIYGQRGANGVILIQTKHGGIHPLEVNVSLNTGITQPIELPQMVGAATYAKALNEARKNDGLQPHYTQQEIKYFKSGKYPYVYPNINWFDQALNKYGTQSSFNATFSGGNKVAQYFALLRYAHFNGLFASSPKDLGYKTKLAHGIFNFRSNLDINLTKRLLLKFNLGAFLYNTHHPHGGAPAIMNALYKNPPTAFPVKLPDGTWGGTQVYTSPRRLIAGTGYNTNNARQIGINVVLRQNLDNWIKGLSVEAALHYLSYGSHFRNKSRSSQYGFITPVYSGNTIIDTTVTRFGQNTNLNYSSGFGNQLQYGSFYGRLNYAHNFGNGKLKAMLIAQQAQEDYDGVNNVDRHRKIAANIHYGLNGKYFFDVVGAYSGRNLLPKGERYNFFPAVSAAWVLSKENFLKHVSFINRLKLRASYGIVGEDKIPRDEPYLRGFDYGIDYHAAYFTDKWSHFNSFGLVTLPSQRFGVSLAHKTDIGINARLFKHLSLTADVFYEHRTHILVGAGGSYSQVIGIPIGAESDGIVDNKGIDGEIKWQEKTGKVTWYLDGQFTYARNTIVNEDEVYRPYDYLKRTDRPMGQEFGLQVIGFFKNEADIKNSPKQLFGPVQPGDIKYKDQNKDGVINEFDEVPIGYASGYPQIYYSASFGIHYKGFGLSATFQGTGLQTAYLNTPSIYFPLANNTSISKWYYKHRWTPQTAATATLPRLTTLSNPNNFRANSIWLVSRAYLDLRYVELSYSLPASINKSLHVDHIKIIARGRNLYNWNHIPVGLPYGYTSSYPLLRYYSLGLNVAF